VAKYGPDSSQLPRIVQREEAHRPRDAPWTSASCPWEIKCPREIDETAESRCRRRDGACFAPVRPFFFFLLASIWPDGLGRCFNLNRQNSPAGRCLAPGVFPPERPRRRTGRCPTALFPGAPPAAWGRRAGNDRPLAGHLQMGPARSKVQTSVVASVTHDIITPHRHLSTTPQHHHDHQDHPPCRHRSESSPP
jgi:hypothetical protein